MRVEEGPAYAHAALAATRQPDALALGQRHREREHGRGQRAVVAAPRRDQARIEPDGVRSVDGPDQLVQPDAGALAKLPRAALGLRAAGGASDLGEFGFEQRPANIRAPVKSLPELGRSVRQAKNSN